MEKNKATEYFVVVVVFQKKRESERYSCNMVVNKCEYVSLFSFYKVKQIASSRLSMEWRRMNEWMNECDTIRAR